MMTALARLSHRQRRAAHLRRISEQMIHRNRYGTRQHARGRHALYLAILLEMRVSAQMLTELRRNAKRDLREGRWYDRPGRDEITVLDDAGELVFEVQENASLAEVGL